MSETTIFDKILSKQMKADIVYEDDHVLAFRDIMPQAPVHVLVIPKKKWTGFRELHAASPEDVGAYMCGISKAAHTLGLDEAGYRVVFNQGKHAQQSVNYIHAHIIGGKQLSWPPGC